MMSNSIIVYEGEWSCVDWWISDDPDYRLVANWFILSDLDLKLQLRIRSQLKAYCSKYTQKIRERDIDQIIMEGNRPISRKFERNSPQIRVRGYCRRQSFLLLDKNHSMFYLHSLSSMVWNLSSPILTDMSQANGSVEQGKEHFVCNISWKGVATYGLKTVTQVLECSTEFVIQNHGFYPVNQQSLHIHWSEFRRRPILSRIYVDNITLAGCMH